MSNEQFQNYLNLYIFLTGFYHALIISAYDLVTHNESSIYSI